jgi:hypothetical protein
MTTCGKGLAHIAPGNMFAPGIQAVSDFGPKIFEFCYFFGFRASDFGFIGL